MDKRYWLPLASLAAIAVFYLLREHAQHLLGMLSYLILLACPLLHLFGHHHHEKHGDKHLEDSTKKPRDESP